MDGNLYERVYRLLSDLDHPDPPGVTHSDRTVALFRYRATADGLSVRRVTDRGYWVGLTPPASWPSQPTLSRRADSPSVRALLARVGDRLRALDPPPAAGGPAVAAVDGRALDVGEHTRDPDARTGRGSGRFERGYKAHALWGAGGLPLAWVVTPMNAAECRVAVALFAALPPVTAPAFVVGDAAYDANYLYAAARERGGHCSPRRRTPAGGWATAATTRPGGPGRSGWPPRPGGRCTTRGPASSGSSAPGAPARRG